MATNRSEETQVSAAVKSDRAADVAIMGSRANSNSGNPIQVRTEVRALKERVGSVRERGGEDAHVIGTWLARLWHMRADEVGGFASFLEFVLREFGITRSRAYEYVRVAAYATGAEAEWGVDVCLGGASIVDLFRASTKLRRKYAVTTEPKRIGDLKDVVFTLADERHVQFSVGKQLELAEVNTLVELLRQQSGLDLGGAGSKSERAASQQLVDALRGREEYAGVEARFGKKKGQKVLQLTVPEGTDLVKLAKLLSDTIKRG